MIVTAQILVVIIGALVVLLSLWGMAFPSRLMRLVRLVLDKSWGMFFAVIVRVILGVSLLVTAPVSLFVIPFKVIGWLALFAAMVLPIFGRQRLVVILDWFQNRSEMLIRAWLVFGVLFGVFLLYGVLGSY